MACIAPETPGHGPCITARNYLPIHHTKLGLADSFLSIIACIGATYRGAADAVEGPLGTTFAMDRNGAALESATGVTFP